MLPWDIKLLMLTNLTELIKWSEKYFYSKSEFSFVSSLALFWFLFNFGGKRNFEKSRMMHENGLVKVYRWCRCAATIRRKKSSIQKRIISLIGCLIDFYRLVKRLRGDFLGLRASLFVSLDFDDIKPWTRCENNSNHWIRQQKKGNRWKWFLLPNQMNELLFLRRFIQRKIDERKAEEVREIDTSAEREIKIFHGPFITFFYVFLINDLLASFKGFLFLRDFKRWTKTFFFRERLILGTLIIEDKVITRLLCSVLLKQILFKFCSCTAWGIKGL